MGAKPPTLTEWMDEPDNGLPMQGDLLSRDELSIPSVWQAILPTIALVAVLALMSCAFLLGRATVGRPHPDVYVVHQDQLTTTTVAP